MICWQRIIMLINYQGANTVQRDWVVWSLIQHRDTHCNVTVYNAILTPSTGLCVLCICRSDGAVVPLGTSKDTGITNPSGYTLNYNGM